MIETTGIAGVAATAVDGILRIYSLFDMGKTLIEIYNDEHNTLQRSFIEAFTKAVDNVSELYDNDSIKSFLENCRQIDNVYYCKDLYDYLCKKNNDREIPLNDNDIVDLSNKITEQLNCIVLNDNEYKNLYNVFSYYQLNNISFKLNELDYIIQKFIDLLSNNKELRSDIAEFARAYKERLFMHSVGDICISLSDIFVMPDVKSKYGIANALDAIRDFINNKNQHVFFLEGFGGYGKSSIVSYLAYNYLFNRSSPNIDFLDDRQLVIIRLRDIRTMLEWYENNYSAKKIALELGNLLKHHYFEKQTKVFIKEALKNNYKPITNRCSPEHLPSIFDLFHNAGGMLTYNYFDEVNKQFDVCIKTLSKRVLDNASYI